MAKTSHARFTNKLQLQDNTAKLALLWQGIFSVFLPARLAVSMCSITHLATYSNQAQKRFFLSRNSEASSVPRRTSETDVLHSTLGQFSH